MIGFVDIFYIAVIAIRILDGGGYNYTQSEKIFTDYGRCERIAREMLHDEFVGNNRGDVFTGHSFCTITGPVLPQHLDLIPKGAAK